MGKEETNSELLREVFLCITPVGSHKCEGVSSEIPHLSAQSIHTGPRTKTVRSFEFKFKTIIKEFERLACAMKTIMAWMPQGRDPRPRPAV